MKKMSPELESEKAAALRLIHLGRPKLHDDGGYICQFCGSSGCKGFEQWHNCDERKAQGIDVRIVR